jgi:hypothetical protein
MLDDSQTCLTALARQRLSGTRSRHTSGHFVVYYWATEKGDRIFRLSGPEILADSLVIKEPAAWLRFDQPAAIRYARVSFSKGGDHKRSIPDVWPIDITRVMTTLQVMLVVECMSNLSVGEQLASALAILTGSLQRNPQYLQGLPCSSRKASPCGGPAKRSAIRDV